MATNSKANTDNNAAYKPKRKAKTQSQIYKHQQRQAKRAQKAFEKDEKNRQKAIEKEQKRIKKIAKQFCKDQERRNRCTSNKRRKRNKHHRKAPQTNANYNVYKPNNHTYHITSKNPINFPIACPPKKLSLLSDEQKQTFTVYGYINRIHWTNVEENITKIILAYFCTKPELDNKLNKVVKSAESFQNTEDQLQKCVESSDKDALWYYGNYIYDYMYQPIYTWVNGHNHNCDAHCHHSHGSDKDYSYDEPTTNSWFNRSRTKHSTDNGCIDGNGKVLMGDNNYKLIKELNVNDEIRSFSGSVSKIMAVMVTDIYKEIKMVYLNGCWITYKHPILLSDMKWVFPKDVCKVEMRYEDKVYNFVLDSEHMINVNGNWCVTLGDGYYKGQHIGSELWTDMDNVKKYLKYHKLNVSHVMVKANMNMFD
eukprot:345844_1